jgi:hypothetical protein
MTENRFRIIFYKTEVSNWQGDNVYHCLEIIGKYINPNQNNIVIAAKHDVICSVSVKELCEAGITKEDTARLRSYNWSIENEHYLMCFV